MKEKLSTLILDYEVYPRNDVSSSVVTALVDAIEMNDPIPPPIVDKATRRVVDGFHRVAAYKRLKRDEIEVVERVYKNDAELFADAVRLNRTHGRAFDPYDFRRAVHRLKDFGLKVAQISDIVRVPRARIEEFIGEFAKGPGASTIVLKRGIVQELRGKTLSKAQVKVNDKYSGFNPTYHVNQLVALLEAGIMPESNNFREGMDQLCTLWRSVGRKKKSA